jgi:hypothetical protein
MPPSYVDGLPPLGSFSENRGICARIKWVELVDKTVYLKSLQMCRDLYVFVLESKEKK